VVTYHFAGLDFVPSNRHADGPGANDLFRRRRNFYDARYLLLA
jgi:hypothetical protein